MSNVANAGPRGLGYTHLTSKWGWFVALGVVLFAAGVFALGDVVAVTLISVIFIGAALLVGGVAQVIHAFMTKGWKAFTFNLLGGIVYIVAGILIMQEPVAGSQVVTIFVLLAMIIGGGVRLFVAFRHRDLPGWWLLALGGVVSIAVGILLYASLPWSGLWVLGTLVGVELIVHGFTWFRLGLTLRTLNRA